MRLAACLITASATADCPPIDTCPWDLNQTHHIHSEPTRRDRIEHITLYQLKLHQDGSFSMVPMKPQAPPATPMHQTASVR